MSSSLSSIEHIDYEIDEKRDGQADGVARSLGGMDNSQQETGISSDLRRKLKRFWKRTRISSMLKKVLAGSKSLFSRMAPRQTKYSTPPEPMQRGETNTTPRVERVKFLEDMIPSPASSSSAASPSASVRTPTLDIHLKDSIPTNSSPTPIPHTKVNDPVIVEQLTHSENADEKSLGDYRYKEKPGKQKSFPEIKIGVVSSRVKWLEPLLSGEKADDKNYSRKEDEIFQDALVIRRKPHPRRSRYTHRVDSRLE